jgi:hypothetical protein
VKEQYIGGYARCQARRLLAAQRLNRVEIGGFDRGEEAEDHTEYALKIAVVPSRNAEPVLPHLTDPEIECLQRLGSGIGEVFAFGSENDASGNIDDDDTVQQCAIFYRLG